MNRRRGSLLVMTLWIVTILGALSVAVARYLSTEVRLTRYRLARHEARELARSGVLVAQQLIRQDTDPVDWSGEPWAETETEPLTLQPADGRTLTVTITDEERKLNVNTATLEQLTSLLGAPAQAIMDYRRDKDAPIAVLNELSDVENLDETARDLLWTNATPHTGTAQNGGPLNLNTALPEVLAAAGLGPATVQTIVQYRDGPEHFTEAGVNVVNLLTAQGVSLGAEESTLLAGPLFAVGSQTFSVASEGVVKSPDVRVRIQAVIRRSTDNTAPKIIAWRER